MENIVYIGSSICSAICSKTSTAPLERIKVLKQSQMYYKNNNYNTLLGSFSYIYKNEGFYGLFKGNLINIYRVFPAYILKFPLNDFGKNKLMKYKNTDKLTFDNKLIIGTLAGLLQIGVTYPLDFLKTRISLDKDMIKNNNNSVFKYTLDVLKNERGGFLSFYKGFLPAATTYPLYVGFQMSIFYHFKEQEYNVLVSGALAGIISQTLMYPGDTLKKQMQLNGINNNKKKYKNVIDCIKYIYRNQGIRGYYPGLWVNIIKSVPGSAIQFLVYDYCREYGLSKI